MQQRTLLSFVLVRILYERVQENHSVRGFAVRLYVPVTLQDIFFPEQCFLTKTSEQHSAKWRCNILRRVSSNYFRPLHKVSVSMATFRGGEGSEGELGDYKRNSCTRKKAPKNIVQSESRKRNIWNK